MNLLVGILMDVYAEVKVAQGSAETLGEQTRKVWRRMKGLRRGERMSHPTPHLSRTTSPVASNRGSSARRSPCPPLRPSNGVLQRAEQPR